MAEYWGKKEKARIMDEQAIGRAVTRISHEILERNEGVENIVILGIHRRGADLALRIADRIEKIEGMRPKFGILDITHYRDDIEREEKSPVIRNSSIDVSLDGMTVPCGWLCARTAIDAPRKSAVSISLRAVTATELTEPS